MNEAATKQVASLSAEVNTYSRLIDEISYLQIETSLAEKKKTIRRLAKFLREQGYVQLGDVIEAKVTEITRKSFCAERR